ncbi:MAG: hypothetical protein GXO47_00410 [Chlorobi bacterium]|nr:hypothetical protein [Chlorobiota bacterium]
MFDILEKKNIQVTIILLHLVLGYVSVSGGFVTGLFYVGIFLYFIFDIIYTRDRGSRAGFYAMYIMGFEIVYRASGMALSAELGKYLSILILLTGLLAGKRKYIPYVFVFVLFLLMPSIFLTEAENLTWIRKLVMFNISGPLTLVFSGMYFYKRPVLKNYFNQGMKLAFYPALTLLVMLSLKAGLDSISFYSVKSSGMMSGGYAPNQVSTAIGWFFLLGLIELIRGNRLLLNIVFDITAITLLLIRGLLTMSRGGMLGAVMALLLAVAYALLIDSRLRVLMKKIFIPALFVGLILFSGIWYANKLSNNYILYRYEGKSTREVLYGEKTKNKDYLTGRGEIMEGDIAAFKAYPILGVGYGMSSRWHALTLGKGAVAHTEFSRLLSENGSLGLLILLICYIFIPLRYFFTITLFRPGQLHFIAFLVFSYATMFHAAMRLAIPGVLYGASFMIISSILNNRRQNVPVA